MDASVDQESVFCYAHPVPEHVTTLDLTDIYTKYAAALGRTVDELEDVQKGQAIRNAIYLCYRSQEIVLDE